MPVAVERFAEQACGAMSGDDQPGIAGRGTQPAGDRGRVGGDGEGVGQVAGVCGGVGNGVIATHREGRGVGMSKDCEDLSHQRH